MCVLVFNYLIILDIYIYISGIIPDSTSCLFEFCESFMKHMY